MITSLPRKLRTPADLDEVELEWADLDLECDDDDDLEDLEEEDLEDLDDLEDLEELEDLWD